MDIELNTSVTKIFTFDSAHHLPDYNGVCARIHGHTYKLEITVSGPSNKTKNIYPTMTCDFGDIKKIVQDEIISKLDHRDLNTIFEYPDYPTAESMARWIFKKMFDVFGPNVKKVRLWETPTSYATVTMNKWRKKNESK